MWKALSIHQPWASLIVAGTKRVENRSWWTPHRGPLLIHASRTTVDLPVGCPARAPDHCPTGCLLGVAILADVVGFDPESETVSPDAADRWPWLPGDRLAFGPWCWILQHAHDLPEPVSMKGRQGLWRPDLADLSPTVRDFLADYLARFGTESAPCPSKPAAKSRSPRGPSPRPARGSTSSPGPNSD
jgi:hypothetical protein